RHRVHPAAARYRGESRKVIDRSTHCSAAAQRLQCVASVHPAIRRPSGVPSMRSILCACLVTLAYASGSAWADDAPPKMKFNEVKEVAPGVFFRFSSIGPEGTGIPFGGSNNIWVVFENYVAVIDANFPKEAKDVIAAVKKTTDKPIRYVLDTHHHGDHA